MSVFFTMNSSAFESSVVSEGVRRFVSGRLMPFPVPSLSPPAFACVILTRIRSGPTWEMTPPIFPSSNQMGWPVSTESKNSGSVTPICAGTYQCMIRFETGWLAALERAGKNESVAGSQFKVLRTRRRAPDPRAPPVLGLLPGYLGQDHTWGKISGAMALSPAAGASYLGDLEGPPCAAGIGKSNAISDCEVRQPAAGDWKASVSWAWRRIRVSHGRQPDASRFFQFGQKYRVSGDISPPP